MFRKIFSRPQVLRRLGRVKRIHDILNKTILGSKSCTGKQSQTQKLPQDPPHAGHNGARENVLSESPDIPGRDAAVWEGRKPSEEQAKQDEQAEQGGDVEEGVLVELALTQEQRASKKW